MSIGRLIVIAGPKAVGKSFFIARLQQQSLPEITELIQMGDPRSWRYVAALEFEEEDQRARARDAEIERLVLHYDLTRPWNRGYARGFIDDKPLGLLGFAKEITFITLWAPCDVLLYRFLARNARFRSKLEWLRSLYQHRFRIGKLDADFRPLYRNPPRVHRIYEDWMGFCGINPATGHWLVASGDERFSIARLEQLPDDFLASVDAWSKESDRVQTQT